MSSVNNCKLSKIAANQQDVIDVLKSIDMNKATEPDEISPKMLHEAGAAIAPSLTRLINLSLSCYTFLDPWKLANAMPLYKKNDKTQINNYQQISLLSCVSKIMECVVFKYTFNFWREMDYSLDSNLVLYQVTRQLANLYRYAIYYVKHWTMKKMSE